MKKSRAKRTVKSNADITQTMGKMLAQVVMPSDDKLAIIQALCQENNENRNKLFVEWGFQDTIEKGLGLVFLFYGDPGTGKTMCAQAIAEHLGKKYLILGTGDLQSAVPGQMERNIKEAFSKAQTNNLVIIFDECDSLLYNRNHVGAILGAEINCLLSEIERFKGVCILTSNRSLLLDPALERRVILKLEFKRPNKEMRKLIWRNIIPAKCPIGKCVNFDELADYDLSGGNIKNVVLSAARMAIFNKKVEVQIEDFLDSIDREIEGSSAFNMSSKVVSRGGGILNMLFDKQAGSTNLTKIRTVEEEEETVNEPRS